MAKRGDRVASKQKSLTNKGIGRAVSIEKLENRQLYASDLGINVTLINNDTYKTVVQMLHDSGTKNIRMWYGFDNYQVRTPERIALYVQKFAHDGFDVTLSVNPRKGRHGSAEETKAMFEYLVNQPGLKESVDRWELGNEPDSEKYWQGTLTDFVSDYIAPASAVLHAAGEKVVSGGVAWNPEDVRTMVNAGLLSYVDYVGFHPYANTVGALKARLATLKQIVGNTPLVATEWNVRGHENDSNKAAWARDVAAFWPVIQANFAMSHYFAAVVQNTMAGPAGILTAKGRANDPFYSMWMSLQGDTTSPTTPTDPTPTDPATPSTPTTGTDGETPGTDTGSGSSGGSTGGTDDGKGTNETPTKPTRPPVETGTDGDDGDGGSTVGSKNEDTPSKGNSSGHSSGGSTGGSSGGSTTPSKPAKPARPTSGQATPTDDGEVVVAPIPPAISSMSLLNADRDRLVKAYAVMSGVVTIDLATTGTEFLSVLASANRKTGSVQFSLNGNTVVDSDGTFTLFGEKRGDLVGATFQAGRSYTLSAQAFSGENATGVAGAITTLSIVVTDSNAPVAVDPAAAALEEMRRRAARRAAAGQPTAGSAVDL